MRKFTIGIQMTILVFLFSSFCFAESEWRGIIPGALGWNVESVVEQWTQTSDIDSESLEQVHWSVEDDENYQNVFVPLAQRYNRQLVITIRFFNLGSETYHFDYSSRLEVSINNSGKNVCVDAIPTAHKTVIAPNGRVKKCSFVLKMSNRTFIDAFDNLNGIGELNINLTNGKLFIEDSNGDSLLDNVETPGRIQIFTPFQTSTIFVFPQIGKSYYVKDVLTSFNQLSYNQENSSTKTPDSFVINNGVIENIFGIPNIINEKSDCILLYSYNKKPIENDKTAELLNMQFQAKDSLYIGTVPVYLLNRYLPPDFYCKLLLDEFKDNIAQLPESIAPKKFQEVNYAHSVEESWLKLKEYAESGDDEAICSALRIFASKDKEFYKTFNINNEEELFKWLKGLADKGYTEAQVAVGLFYENGSGVKANLSKAIKYYKMAADKDHADSMVFYANAISRKDSKNFDESLKWYQKAAELDSPRGQFLYALALDKINQNKESIEWLQKSADNGYPEAMYLLGKEYYFGVIVPRDDKKAFSLVEKAAKNRFVKAYGMLGYFYLRGIGVEQNGKMAAFCYRRGAIAGVPEAKYWYGIFLCDGYNVEKDVSKGYGLIKEAAEQEYSDAMMYIGLDYHTGGIAQKNPTKAFFWLKKAADKNNPTAIAVLGDVYIQGDGVKADKEKGLELYKKAAEMENPYGIFRWGQHLYEQNGINAQMGLNYIKAAAKMGNKAAQDYLDQLDGLKKQDDDNQVNDDSAINDDSNDNEDIDDANAHNAADNIDDDIDDLDEEDDSDVKDDSNNETILTTKTTLTITTTSTEKTIRLYRIPNGQLSFHSYQSI